MRLFALLVICAACGEGSTAIDAPRGAPDPTSDPTSPAGGDAHGSSGGATPPNGNTSGGGTTPPPASNAIVFAIVSGDGSAVLTNWPNDDPLIVHATKGGAPIAGASVTFAPKGDVGVYPATTTTDADGRAETIIRGYGLVNPGNSWSVGSVTATLASGESVVFHVTTTNSGTSYPRAPATQLVTPEDRHAGLGTGKVGTIVPGGIKVRVNAALGGQQNQPIPGVGIRLFPDGDLRGTTFASCVGGTAMTDATGIATCDVRFDKVGSGQVSVIIGGYVYFPNISITVTP